MIFDIMFRIILFVYLNHFNANYKYFDSILRCYNNCLKIIINYKIFKSMIDNSELYNQIPK